MSGKSFSGNIPGSTDGSSGFIDLILENGITDTVLVIECKRVVDCSWIFLIDDMMERRHAKGWVSHYGKGSFKRFRFEELQVEPMTPQSEYCVVDGQTPFDSELISLSTGAIDNGAKYTEVPFLRFRKQLGSHRDMPTVELNRRGYRKIATAKERTVFIVNAESFSEFLERFEIAALGPE